MNSSPLTCQDRRALTLVEMLVGMAITLVMMAAVVNLFANISQGVRNRRATMEVSANLRTARAQLYNDLAGATCLQFPKNTHGVPLKPDSNNMPDGYFEYVEGPLSDTNPTFPNSFDPATSLVPSSGAPFDADGQPTDPNVVTDGRGLGDYDDVLAMTVESPSSPFRGRGRGLRPGGNPAEINPSSYGPTGDWVDMAISSPVAEVIWFAKQNPMDRSEGEPGMRKIYRRVLLVAPWYGSETKNIGGTEVTGSDPLLDVSALTFPQQVAALRAFQQLYDISVRLENGRIVPNTLVDLTRRENRYEHMPSDFASNPPSLNYPHPFASRGSGYAGTVNVQVIRHHLDTESNNAQITATTAGGVGGEIVGFNVTNGGRYDLPPTLLVLGTTGTMATARPVMRPLDGAWEIGGVEFGPVPLAFERTGEDLVLGDVLAFDVKIYDEGAANIYIDTNNLVQPGNAGWRHDFVSTDLASLGAYVDLAYWPKYRNYWGQVLQNLPAPVRPPLPPAANPNPTYYSGTAHFKSLLSNLNIDSWLTYSAYDTWTTYYETDGFDQDGDGIIDQGTNGLDDAGLYDHDNDPTTPQVPLTIHGPDDSGERETSPPYPYPLHGVQVKIRIYEPESRQIRETTVTKKLAE